MNPDFCLTGIPCSTQPKKLQSEQILNELRQESIIAAPITRKSGMAFTIGETESLRPRRLPSLHNKPRKINKQSIENSLLNAAIKRQVLLCLEYYQRLF